MNVLIWIIILVNTQKAITKLITLQERHQFYFIGQMEPFQERQIIKKYKKDLGRNMQFQMLIVKFGPLRMQQLILLS